MTEPTYGEGHDRHRADENSQRDRRAPGAVGNSLFVPSSASKRFWATVAGDRLPELLQSREGAKRFLQDESWKLRLAAIAILSAVWGKDDDLANVCEEMAFADPHPQVRGTALFKLAACYEGTNDPRVGTMLARIVNDSTFEERFRETAYFGLFWIRGVPLLKRPRIGKFCFPDDVDWTFVDSFFRSSGEPKRGNLNGGT